jgi:hypothetical protein
MSDRLIIAMLLSFSILGAVVSSSSLKESFGNGNTDISLSLSEKEIMFTASYPKAKAKKVHAWVKEALHLNDLPDMQSVEIKQYTTPDGYYAMYLKSRDGYLKLRLDPRRNPPEAFEHIKMICEGVKKVLAEN